MTDRIIYHICRTEDWQAASAAGYYLGSTQDRRDGFIHFATSGQIVETAARHRAGESGLVLLAVDTARCGADLVWEPSTDGDLFPHLYTRLMLSAVVATRPLPLGADGRHVFPPLGPDGFE